MTLQKKIKTNISKQYTLYNYLMYNYCNLDSKDPTIIGVIPATELHKLLLSIPKAFRTYHDVLPKPNSICKKYAMHGQNI